MKNPVLVVSLVLLLCFVFGCQNKAEKAELEKFRAQAKVEEQNKALITRFADVYQKRDAEALKEILSPNYVWHGQMGYDMSQKEIIEDLKEMTKTEGVDFSYFTQDIFAKGDRVGRRYKALSATGKKLELMAIEIYRIENGKIVESWELDDYFGYLLKQKEEKK